jgi:hypothetical protein
MPTEYSNARLSAFCGDPSNSQFIGATQIGANPLSIDASAGVGKSGDYYYGDPSLFLNVGGQWLMIGDSSSGQIITKVPNW